MKKIIKTFLCLLLLVNFAACNSNKENITIVVNFDSDGGSNINAIVFHDKASKLDKPTDPTKEGYKFVEWDLNGKVYDFNTIVDQDITLKAIWQKADDNKQDDTNTILCTSLESLYHSYWANEGVSPYNLEVKALPENCTEKITYKSNDESIVSVDQNGNVTVGKVGKTTIQVTCGSQSLILEFETKEKTIELEKIEVEDITIKVGQKATIKTKFYPEDTTEKTLKYLTADSARVTVNENGEIEGIIAGPCAIEITDANGKTYICDVMVEGTALEFSLPLYSEFSFNPNNDIFYTIQLHEYADGQENIIDVWHEAQIHSEKGNFGRSNEMMYLMEDPGEMCETNVWFTYDKYVSNKIPVYIKP